MKEVFDSVETVAKTNNKNRWVTTVDSIQTFDDVKDMLRAILKVLQDIKDKKI